MQTKKRDYKIFDKTISADLDTNQFYTGQELKENFLMFYKNINIFVRTNQIITVEIYESENGTDYIKTQETEITTAGYAKDFEIIGDYFYLKFKPTTTTTINFKMKSEE